MLIKASRSVSVVVAPAAKIAIDAVPFFGVFGLSTLLAALHDLLFC
jgi:hypothetical protein